MASDAYWNASQLSGNVRTGYIPLALPSWTDASPRTLRATYYRAADDGRDDNLVIALAALSS